MSEHVSADEITDEQVDAFCAIWRVYGDLPYGPGRVRDYTRPDGTLDREGLIAADCEADRLNNQVIRDALAAAWAMRKKEQRTE